MISWENSTMHRLSKLFVLVLTIGVLAFAHTYAHAQSPYFSKWPAGSSPAEVGKRVAEKFLARKLEAEEGKRKFVIYPEVCAWYGAKASLTSNGTKPRPTGLRPKRVTGSMTCL